MVCIENMANVYSRGIYSSSLYQEFLGASIFWNGIGYRVGVFDVLCLLYYVLMRRLME